MGFFKDVHKLSKMGNEMQKNNDVKGDMARASASMAAATQMMADNNAMVAAANGQMASQGASGGRAVTATITAVRDTGTFINHCAVLDIDLLVMGLGAPFPVTRKELVSVASLGRAVVGGQLVVQVTEDAPPAVWIDWVTLP